MVLAVSAAGPARAQAAGQDPWFGPDKALHFGACFGLSVTGYAAGAILSPDEPALRLGLGAGLALGAGIGKELFDLAAGGSPSWRDLTWDAIGTATGLLIAWTVDWLFFEQDRPPRSSKRPRPLVPPHREVDRLNLCGAEDREHLGVDEDVEATRNAR
ncbi:MAG: hypothetical protein ACYC8T_05120, partial [Myxococcaceae bacterium]